jgi:hypothetical protein
MKKLITAIALLLATMPAMAITDYVCFHQCRDAGMSYGYCLKACEY